MSPWFLLLAGGGSIITVPVLVYALRVEPREAAVAVFLVVANLGAVAR